jgi:flagellar protein FlgJ
MLPLASASGSMGLATDSRSIDGLRGTAARDPKAAIRETAKQFESLFMNELMKSMRASTMSSGMLDNEGSKMATEMLDTQFATKMSGLPGGLSDVIARQLERQMGVTPTTSAAGKESVQASVQRTPLRAPASAQEFVARQGEAAKAAEAATGIPATFMVAQAALETGWGKKEIKMADGSNSFNLFGIKAGANWKGPTTDITTTEYVNGKAQKMTQRFRAYSSYEEGFTDYAKLMKDNPRYANVVANASSAQGFAQGLQKAGYATDPAYAKKLGAVINTALRLQQASA